LASSVIGFTKKKKPEIDDKYKRLANERLRIFTPYAVDEEGGLFSRIYRT